MPSYTGKCLLAQYYLTPFYHFSEVSVENNNVFKECLVLR